MFIFQYRFLFCQNVYQLAKKNTFFQEHIYVTNWQVINSPNANEGHIFYWIFIIVPGFDNKPQEYFLMNIFTIIITVTTKFS